jgi:hypothetical protein
MYDKLDSACKRLHDPPLTCHLIDDCGIACWSSTILKLNLEGQTLGKVLVYKRMVWIEFVKFSNFLYSLYIAIVAKQHGLCHLRGP